MNREVAASRDNGKKLHLMGLTSTGGVHSSLDHLFKLIEIGKEYGLITVFAVCQQLFSSFFEVFSKSFKQMNGERGI